jgi:hypothetical protein
LLCCFSQAALADGNELAVLGGAHFPVSYSTIVLTPSGWVMAADASTGFALQGNYSRRLLWWPVASLYLDLPAVASFDLNVSSPDIPAPRDYSALCVTPGLKVKPGISVPVSPFVVVGIGLARFKKAGQLTTGEPNTGDRVVNHSVFEIGAGADIWAAPRIDLRGEIRDSIQESRS